MCGGNRSKIKQLWNVEPKETLSTVTLGSACEVQQDTNKTIPPKKKKQQQSPVKTASPPFALCGGVWDPIVGSTSRNGLELFPESHWWDGKRHSEDPQLRSESVSKMLSEGRQLQAAEKWPMLCVSASHWTPHQGKTEKKNPSSGKTAVFGRGGESRVKKMLHPSHCVMNDTFRLAPNGSWPTARLTGGQVKGGGGVASLWHTFPGDPHQGNRTQPHPNTKSYSWLTHQ